MKKHITRLSDPNWTPPEMDLSFMKDLQYDKHQNIITEAVNRIAKNVNAMKEGVVNETLLHYYNVTPCEDAYKRLTRLKFDDEQNSEYYYLDLPPFENAEDIKEEDKRLVAMFKTVEPTLEESMKEPFRIMTNILFDTPYKQCSWYNK